MQIQVNSVSLPLTSSGLNYDTSFALQCLQHFSLNLEKTGQVCQDIKTWSENLQTGKVYVKKCLIAIMPQIQGEVKKKNKLRKICQACGLMKGL